MRSKKARNTSNFSIKKSECVVEGTVAKAFAKVSDGTGNTVGYTNSLIAADYEVCVGVIDIVIP